MSSTLSRCAAGRSIESNACHLNLPKAVRHNCETGGHPFDGELPELAIHDHPSQDHGIRNSACPVPGSACAQANMRSVLVSVCKCTALYNTYHFETRCHELRLSASLHFSACSCNGRMCHGMGIAKPTRDSVSWHGRINVARCAPSNH